MSLEMAQQGKNSATTDSVIHARLKQIKENLHGPEAEDQSIVIFAALVGALVLSRGAESGEFKSRILDVTRENLKTATHTAII